MKTGAPKVIVLGGTGFLGRRVVRRLQAHGYKVIVGTRSPAAAAAIFRSGEENVGLLKIDLQDFDSLQAALSGATALINCIGFYHETRGESFRDVHAVAAGRIAALAKACGGPALIHISGIGSSLSSPSAYVRARAEGETAVRDAYHEATILRPSVMFSRTGAFFGDLEQIVRKLPVIPLFGNGSTRLQPVWAGDVAEAVCCLLNAGKTLQGAVYELGGPEVFTYRGILNRIIEQSGCRRILLPVPFVLWRLAAAALSLLREPPLTPAHAALMQQDNTVGDSALSFRDLGIEPRSAVTMGLL